MANPLPPPPPPPLTPQQTNKQKTPKNNNRTKTHTNKNQQQQVVTKVLSGDLLLSVASEEDSVPGPGNSRGSSCSSEGVAEVASGVGVASGVELGADSGWASGVELGADSGWSPDIVVSPNGSPSKVPLSVYMEYKYA